LKPLDTTVARNKLWSRKILSIDLGTYLIAFDTSVKILQLSGPDRVSQPTTFSRADVSELKIRVVPAYSPVARHYPVK